MKILITGAKGLVGSALAGHCSRIGDEVTALTHSDLDITDEAKVRSAIAGEKPDALVNCAAFTDVDGSETEIESCLAVNRDAVGSLAAVCRESGTAFVTISTDYVFDGMKEGFYFEHDKPIPLSVYGKAKLAGETAALKENDKSIIVRTGWIFGENGTNFLSVLGSLLADGEQITAIEDSYGTPTYAPDLANRLRELAESKLSGLFHVTNAGNGTSYAGFAIDSAKILGVNESNVELVRASSLKRPARRPINSKLGCGNAPKNGFADLPHWQDALRRHLSK